MVPQFSQQQANVMPQTYTQPTPPSVVSPLIAPFITQSSLSTMSPSPTTVYAPQTNFWQICIYYFNTRQASDTCSLERLRMQAIQPAIKLLLTCQEKTRIKIKTEKSFPRHPENDPKRGT